MSRFKAELSSSTSNSLPIALMQSLTYTVDSLKWGTQDTRDAMLGRALSYLVLFSTLGIILRWSYGIKLLSTADDEAPPDPEEQPIAVNERNPPSTTTSTTHGEINHDVSAPLLEEDEGNGDAGTTENGNGTTKSLRVKTSTPRFQEGPVTVARPPDIRRRAPERRWTALGSKGDIGDVEYFGRNLTTAERSRLFRQEFSNFRSFPNTPTRTPAASSYASSTAGGTDSEDDEDDEFDEGSDGEYEGLGRRTGTAPSRNRWQAKFRRNKRNCMHWSRRNILQPLGRFWKGFNNFMTAPLYAALLSLVVGEPLPC